MEKVSQFLSSGQTETYESKVLRTDLILKFCNQGNTIFEEI